MGNQKHLVALSYFDARIRRNRAIYERCTIELINAVLFDYQIAVPAPAIFECPALAMTFGGLAKSLIANDLANNIVPIKLFTNEGVYFSKDQFAKDPRPIELVAKYYLKRSFETNGPHSNHTYDFITKEETIENLIKIANDRNGENIFLYETYTYRDFINEYFRRCYTHGNTEQCIGIFQSDKNYYANCQNQLKEEIDLAFNRIEQSEREILFKDGTHLKINNNAYKGIHKKTQNLKETNSLTAHTLFRTLVDEIDDENARKVYNEKFGPIVDFFMWDRVSQDMQANLKWNFNGIPEYSEYIKKQGYVSSSYEEMHSLGPTDIINYNPKPRPKGYDSFEFSAWDMVVMIAGSKEAYKLRGIFKNRNEKVEERKKALKEYVSIIAEKLSGELEFSLTPDNLINQSIINRDKGVFSITLNKVSHLSYIVGLTSAFVASEIIKLSSAETIGTAIAATLISEITKNYLSHKVDHSGAQLIARNKVNKMMSHSKKALVYAHVPV
ncbi:MAG: hypothetical protein AAF228_12125 [Pseudomonadota bacterium]